MRRFLQKNWVLIIAILYVLSPIDVLPDFLPLVGYSDDLLVLIGSLLIGYVQYKKERGKILEGEVVED